MRKVEMYVGVFRGDHQEWFTEFVNIPADTPDEQIPTVAEAVLLKELERSNLQVAFVGVYNIPEISDE